MRILIRLFWRGLNAIEIYFSRANHYLAISCISGAEWKINPRVCFHPEKKKTGKKAKQIHLLSFPPIPVSMAKINQDVQTAKSPQHSSWLIYSLVQIPSQILFHPVSPVPSLLSSVPPFFPSPCMFFRFVWSNDLPLFTPVVVRERRVGALERGKKSLLRVYLFLSTFVRSRRGEKRSISVRPEKSLGSCNSFLTGSRIFSTVWRGWLGRSLIVLGPFRSVIMSKPGFRGKLLFFM